jgi:myo-inositol-1(or 4)-monophosphatase
MTDTTKVLIQVSAIARQAGDIALRHFGRVVPDKKTDRSYVTAADRDVEEFVRRELGNSFPEDAIIGEENEDESGTSEYTWAIDPIDGTTNFVLGLPHWAICIGRMRNGVPDLGVVQLPALDEQYAGATNLGATMNGHTLRVHPSPVDPNERILSMGSSFHRELQVDLLDGYMHSHGSTVVQLLYLARGIYMGAVTPRVHVWDVAAGLPILWEAGGVTCLPDGTHYDTMNLLPEAGFVVPPLIHAPELEFEHVRSMIAFRS